MPTSYRKLLEFRAFFIEAEKRGVEQLEAAEALLSRLKARPDGISAFGIQRKWDPISSEEEMEWMRREERLAELRSQLRRQYGDDLENLPPHDPAAVEVGELERASNQRVWDRERLPRALDHTRVRAAHWHRIARVERDLTSCWQDDGEKPTSVFKVDWAQGVLEVNAIEVSGSETVEIEHVIETYSALSLDRREAHRLLNELSGAVEKRGAPQGPREPQEAEWVEQVVNLKRGGDQRQIGAIVREIVPPAGNPDNPDADTNRRRRVTDHAKKRLKD